MFASDNNYFLTNSNTIAWTDNKLKITPLGLKNDPLKYLKIILSKDGIFIIQDDKFWNNICIMAYLEDNSMIYVIINSSFKKFTLLNPDYFNKIYEGWIDKNKLPLELKILNYNKKHYKYQETEIKNNDILRLINSITLNEIQSEDKTNNILVSLNPINFYYLENQSEKMCLEFIEKNHVQYFFLIKPEFITAKILFKCLMQNKTILYRSKNIRFLGYLNYTMIYGKRIDFNDYGTTILTDLTHLIKKNCDNINIKYFFKELNIIANILHKRKFYV